MPNDATTVKRQKLGCSCRYLEHAPSDCPYPAGCTGCLCDVHSTDVAVWCEPCDEWTVHLDEHEHPEALFLLRGAHYEHTPSGAVVKVVHTRWDGDVYVVAAVVIAGDGPNEVGETVTYRLVTTEGFVRS